MSYIKLHRDLLDSFCFANPNHLKIWVWLLLRANYKSAFVPVNIGRGFITVEIKRGQLIFGRFKAEEELNLNGNLIYRTIQKFEELGQISIEVNSHFSLITICNYDSYQGKDNESEQAMNNQRTSNEQHVNNTRTTREHIQEELEEKEEIRNNISTNFHRQPNIPTLEQVRHTFFQQGGTDEMAEAFFNKHSGTGWFLNGSPIVNYSTLISNFIINFNKFKTKNNAKSRTEQTNSTLGYLKRKGEELYREIERKKNSGDQS